MSAPHHDNSQYVGSELDLFKRAHNWKGYIKRRLAKHIRGDVCEVGAGIGGTTEVFAGLSTVDTWLCIEPDISQIREIEKLRQISRVPGIVSIFRGTLLDTEARECFDTIIYIDVLEHIAEDRDELQAAIQRLRPGGNLIVLAPAWQFLFSPFDQAVGHYRRYTHKTLAKLSPSNSRMVLWEYLDSIGFLASCTNRVLLRQELPTRAQIAIWDRIMIPISGIFDRILFFRFGKSVVAIWTKT